MTVTIESVQAKLAKIQAKLATLERRLDERASVHRVQQHLMKPRVKSASLKKAPRDYYKWTLEQRGKLLGCGVPHLCKSIIVENIACTNTDTKDPLNSRYYCVVLQYNAKLNTEQLQRFIRSRIPKAQCPSKKFFNFQHAPGKKTHELTGFSFNAVSPFGMKTRIPVIVSGAVAKLNPPFIWLGGGAENIKLRVSVPELVSTLHAVIAEDLTTLRDDTKH